jgi:hypothetical protein
MRAAFRAVGLVVSLVVIDRRADVAGAKPAFVLGEGEANAVAIPERRRSVKLKFGQREAGGGELRAEPFGFVRELRGVGQVL